jgi:hypothetical protein
MKAQGQIYINDNLLEIVVKFKYYFPKDRPKVYLVNPDLNLYGLEEEYKIV